MTIRRLKACKVAPAVCTSLLLNTQDGDFDYHSGSATLVRIVRLVRLLRVAPIEIILLYSR